MRSVAVLFERSRSPHRWNSRPTGIPRDAFVVLSEWARLKSGRKFQIVREEDTAVRADLELPDEELLSQLERLCFDYGLVLRFVSPEG